MIIILENRIKNEISHGRKISRNAEYVWGWDSKTGRIRAERRANFFLQYGNINSNSYVLELGCGTGIFTEKVYASSMSKIIAIDISDDLLFLAKAKGINAQFLNFNAMKLPFNENTFDCVFGSSVLHHLDIYKAMEQVFGVLKEGGKIVFAEPNMLNPQIFLQKNIPALKKFMGDSPDEVAIVKSKMHLTLKSIGFKNIHIFPYDFLHPLTPDFCIPIVCRVGKILEKIPILNSIAGSLLISAEK